jgi:heme/copper-type cytochrome/quinol oxidase subunit 3
MSASAAGGVAFEPEDPSAVARNLSAGVRLLISAIGFVFMAFVFAFFYLKALNSYGDWRPTRVHPPQGYGIAVLVCVLATTASFELARRSLAQPGPRAWVWGLSAALGLSIAAAVLEGLQLANTGFASYNGGYASVFYGWTVVFLVVWLGAVYWVETLLATGMRRLPGPEMPDADPLELLRPSADACTVYLYFLVGIEVIAYVLLYLIK